MKLISSREAVNFLAQAAPRPWVQRFLRWMAFDEGLAGYSSKGRIQPHTYVFEMTMQLLERAGETSGPNMDRLIREEFSDDIAQRLVGRDPQSRFDDDPVAWDENDDPKRLDEGFFLFASHIDWELGTISVDYVPDSGDMYETFFPDSEFIQSQFERANYEGLIEGLSFEFSRIELLLPSLELGQTTGFMTAQSDNRRPVGRPAKWDWEGAMAHVVALAQHPDGLPTGPGAQARVEELISNWFVNEVQEAPASSQVRQRAAKIMRMIETLKIR